MKKHSLVAGLLVLAGAFSQAATDDPVTTLQKGLYEEEANHDLPAAVQLYQAVIERFDNDRKLAATAVFRLGECYRKQGKTKDAAVQYERVLREFADQAQLVGISRQNLLALGGTLPGATSQALPAAAREEQKRLLEQELKLVEQQLVTEKKKAESGIVSRESLINLEREVLKLKRQLAAIETGEAPRGGLAASDPAAVTNVEAEEVKRIQAMIKDSPDLINALTGGTTPLIKAAMAGQLTVAKFLLGAGADPETKDASNSRTPLYWAAFEGHKGMVELLLASKARPGNPDVNGRTPLHAAAEHGYRTVAEVLINNGAEVNAADFGKATPLHLAIGNGFRSMAELLLDKGADVNANAVEVNTANRRVRGTALHVATYRSDTGLTELLLKRKANPELVNEEGKTPLHVAAMNGYQELAGLLLDAGAVVDTRNATPDERGFTALHYAVVNGRAETVTLLLRHKADPNARIQSGFNISTQGPPSSGRSAGSGYTPLLMATAKCLPPIIESLLAAKADPNQCSDSGDTAIINTMTHCKETERPGILTGLLEHGAKTDPVDRDGNTALLIASYKKDRVSLELLLRYQADSNARSKRGSFTALHYLVFWFRSSGPYENVVPMAKALISAKADVNAQDQEGRTPLKYASELLVRGTSGDAFLNEFAELLRQAGAVEDLPQLDRIEIARPSANVRNPVFWKDRSDYNRFSLFELIAVQYGMCTAPARPSTTSSVMPGPSPGSISMPMPVAMQMRINSAQELEFPDFDKVVIRRATPDGKSRKEVRVALQTVFEAGECLGDMPLKWGDVVEVPEADHPINVNWLGLPDKTRELLVRCLRRTVEVRVKGQSTNMVLSPNPSSGAGPGADFSFTSVLNASGLLRASSDLSKVKVTRHDRAYREAGVTEPRIGQSYEMQLDCSSSGNGYQTWVQDRDIIEVPEK